MKAIQRILAMALVLMMLACVPAAFADDSYSMAKDGFSTSYTYNYDYWGDVQMSPDAYRATSVIDSVALGLDDLDGVRMNKPQSLFVRNNDLYIVDTGNNRLIQIRFDGDTYKLVRTISEMKGGNPTTFNGPTDCFVDADDNIYVADYNNHRIVMMDKNLKYIKQFVAPSDAAYETAEETATEDEAAETVTETTEEVVAETTEAVAEAVEETAEAVTEIAEEAVADTAEAAVEVVAETAEAVAEMAEATTETVEETATETAAAATTTKSTGSQEFLPKKIVVDVAGRVYALVTNVNKGLVKYEPDTTFTGYIGANTVKVDMAEYMWKRYFMTQAQREQSVSFVPTEYENVYIDSEGFIFATNTVFSEYDLKSDVAKPIRRINSIGNDILIKDDRYPPIGDQFWIEGSASNGPSKLTDVTVLDNGVYIAIDRTRGRIFGYDKQGVMLWAFGTKGNVEGAFTSAISIEHMGYNLFVLDQLENTVTVFKPTEYGMLVYDALNTYLSGEYLKSSDLWQEVMKMNANYPLAFRGIGLALNSQDKYEEAMEYFKKAHDRENYGRAFKFYRKAWVEKNIGWVLLILAVVIIVPLVIGKIKKMKGEVIYYEHSKVRKDK